jgi:hypothetical protein
MVIFMFAQTTPSVCPLAYNTDTLAISPLGVAKLPATEVEYFGKLPSCGLDQDTVALMYDVFTRSSKFESALQGTDSLTRLGKFKAEYEKILGGFKGA